MNEGSDKKFWIISIIIILVVLGLTYKFVIMHDTSGNNAGSSNVEKNDKPALTLKADKEAQAEKKKKAEEDNKKEESKSDDKKDSKKDDKKENDKNTDVKALKKEAQTNAETVLDIQGKPKDDFKSDNTQARFKESATEQFVKTHQKNDNKGNRKIEYKNVSLNLDKDEDVKKDKFEGVLKFDRLIKPKDKDSKVKASTEVDSKLQVTFEKEDGKLKVAKTQM